MSVERFVYILSPSYSGSTLLTYLLGVHPDIATIGELKASALGNIDTYDCSCGTPIRNCPFWSQLQSALHSRGVAFTLNNFGTHFRTPDARLTDRILGANIHGAGFEALRDFALTVIPSVRQAYRRVLAQNVALASAVCDLQRGRVFLDGSKDPHRLKLLLGAGFSDIRVLHMIRDGRAASNSYMRHYDAPMSTAAHAWLRTHRASERVLRLLPPDRAMRIRYEDLCTEPALTLRQIYTFLELDPGGAPVELDTQSQHVLGNAMRLRRSTDIRLDEKWKHALTPADLCTFDRIAGQANAAYGYSPTPAHVLQPVVDGA